MRHLFWNAWVVGSNPTQVAFGFFYRWTRQAQTCRMTYNDEVYTGWLYGVLIENKMEIMGPFHEPTTEFTSEKNISN